MLMQNRSDQRGWMTHVRVNRAFLCLPRQSSGPLGATTQFHCIDRPALPLGEGDTPFARNWVHTSLYLSHITYCTCIQPCTRTGTHTDIHICTHPHTSHEAHILLHMLHMLHIPSVSTSTASCPKEIDLRSLVAAKLGQDWRKVCSYLGLQQYQLHQAEAAHTHLEEKAMEALVMWVQGQGESKAPRSWKTLVEALCRAHRNDIACDLEI